MAHTTIGRTLSTLMIKNVPAYANKFIYSLGFLSMISFVLLIITGTIMAAFGPDWWLTTGVGQYARSIHLWATQAFVVFIVLHLAIVFFSSGFKAPRQLTWVIGVLMMFLVFAESEFGYVLRGDFSSQWRALQGADFYNGSGLGSIINTLNYNQIFGIHIVVVPLVLLVLLFCHYLLVRVLGIAKPYRSEVKVATVPASHTLLFARGGALVVLVLGLAAAYPSPFLKSTTIAQVAQEDPTLMAKTLSSEFDATSSTAGYKDNIAPYNFDVRKVYIDAPYRVLLASQPGLVDQLKVFDALSPSAQAAQLKQLSDYYGADSQAGLIKPTTTPAAKIVDALSSMAAAGLYEPSLIAANHTDVTTVATRSSYALRFLADTGTLDDRATNLKLTTAQYGMLREESSGAPGAWWLYPIGLLNHTVLSGDENGDRDAAAIFGSLLILMVAFPFIPYLNQVPDRLRLAKLIWHVR